MLQAEFHTGVSEPLRFACRLLRKAWRQGAQVQVAAPASTLQALDRELWVFEANEFVPHLRVRTGQTMDTSLQRTPIWLCESDAPVPGPKILVSLGGAMPRELDRFERIIEVVSDDAEERKLARQRWRDYLVRGVNVVHHAQGQAAAPKH
jgi:DNA polymerase III subunit chi